MKSTDLHQWLNKNLEIIIPFIFLILGAAVNLNHIKAYIIGVTFAGFAIFIHQVLNSEKRSERGIKHPRPPEA